MEYSRIKGNGGSLIQHFPSWLQPPNHWPQSRQATRIARRYFLRIELLAIVFWSLLIRSSERTAFTSSIDACNWRNWEQWPDGARPHHVAFLADPQLVDPHTYPGRPWPLSSLTETFTDLYMSRSYRLLQRDLDPDTVYFLGDLFDGGREWETAAQGFVASEEQWKRYKHDYWLGEHTRFARIFLDPLQISGGAAPYKDKTIIASLPGNHDLGFGTGIQKVVRNRFQAYFGKGDRVDIVGNHTFIGLDTVSLSAMNIPEGKEETWRPTVRFLDNIQDTISQAVSHELSHRYQLDDSPSQHDHTVGDLQTAERSAESGQAVVKHSLPAVLLTHVPFFREPGTPCGPLRERSPPSGPDLTTDEPNAIRVAGGYQYQNVLHKDITKLIAEKIGNIGNIFSGDDHDYCEVVHRAYPSAGAGIREITVKSMSWAMGVRKPGFVVASLWNPINADGSPIESEEAPHAGDTTIQTHLCLLPDQLGIFIRYALCFGLTLVVLAVHATLVARRQSKAEQAHSSSFLLPVRQPTPPSVWQTSKASSYLQGRSRASSGSALTDGNGFLAARSQNSRTRSISPVPYSGYSLPHVHTNSNIGPPLIERAGYFGEVEEDDWSNGPEKKAGYRNRRRGFASLVIRGFGHSLLLVGCPAVLWYWWLVRSG